jgi:hypothetical protein
MILIARQQTQARRQSFLKPIWRIGGGDLHNRFHEEERRSILRNIEER